MTKVPEIILPPGWLARDVERAQARLQEWNHATLKKNRWDVFAEVMDTIFVGAVCGCVGVVVYGIGSALIQFVYH